MMEASATSETLANFHQAARRNNPEDSHLYTRRCENRNLTKCKVASKFEPIFSFVQASNKTCS
jgi:hypothetical protein